MSILSISETLLSINKCDFEVPAKKCDHCGRRNYYNQQNVDTSPYEVVTSTRNEYWADLCTSCVASLEESVAPDCK